MFTRAYLDFFAELAENNTREWFKANKERYETEVKQPFQDFVGHLLLRIRSELQPDLFVEPRDCIFRIYRDVRFSKDKTPHKLHQSAVIHPRGKKAKQEPGFYFEMGKEGLGVFAGLYAPSRAQIYELRAAMAQEPQRLAEIAAEPLFQELFGDIQGERYKRIPKEYRELGESQPLFYHKQWYVQSQLPGETLLRPDLDELMLQHYRAAQDFNAYLNEQAGPVEG